ncbi:hypothetical protein ACFQE5_09880 [Pseudonocardia hispaniensis]|uniref:Uncharacterized protein n=1 Tax=Pseudonocardia hispaniensis TaxID=904933 RepID=A0ABW1J114_9PSEU
MARILVLGGTVFLSRAVAAAALGLNRERLAGPTAVDEAELLTALLRTPR